MKFKELFQDVEDWFWKLEFNPETSSYELYLGIPNDWVYSEKNGGITIELIHELEDNSIIKIYVEDSETSEVTIDDIIDISKSLISKNQELEKRKELHRLEMEKLKDQLIEKEKNFLEYVDQVKDNTLIETAVVSLVSKMDVGVIKELSEGLNDGANEGVSDGVESGKGEDFIKDIEKLKLS